MRKPIFAALLLLTASLAGAQTPKPALRSPTLVNPALKPVTPAVPVDALPKPAVRAGQTTPSIKRPDLIKPVDLTLHGYVDLHAHPMSYLGFGRKAMHGAPDVDAIIPAGTRGCNRTEQRTTSAADALGNCNSTHGGWGLDNTCGDYLRAGIINYAMDDKFKYKVSFDRNPHGDHEHAGYPDFNYWPHQSSILHQQMWWEWLRRAYDGGLRVMVALTVNSELLAEILNGDPPYDDKTVADVQIDQMIHMVKNHSDFMEVAYSAADIRRIVTDNKLAVVLGMEVDKLGNFGKPGVKTDDAAVRAEIQRLYRKGIRYAFPIHLIDNSFGGTAVYDMMFNFANKRANGYHFRVYPSPDRNVEYNASLTSGPLGLENALILSLAGFLQGVGQIPAPCFNDAIKCAPPPGKVLCCGSFQSVLNVMTPTPELDVYKLIPPGHVNAIGLTRLGEIAINEMMKLGMIIDVDHMSERAMTRAIEIAENVPGDYPLVMGHNGVRAAHGNERSAPAALVTRLTALGGMMGLGTAKNTPSEFISNYRTVWSAMGNRALGIGTDADGFEPLPRHEKSQDPATSSAFYSRFLSESGITTKQVTGSHTWDYVLEGGVSHYGLMPEFLFDVKTSPLGSDVIDHLMQSAEHFAQMWQKAETAAAQVAAMPLGGTYNFDFSPLTNLCPSQRTAGDGEFGGNGPRVSGSVTLAPSADGTSLLANVSFTAQETAGDGSTVKGSWSIPVGEPAAAGTRYSKVNGTATAAFDQILQGGGRNELFEGCDGGEHVISLSSGPVSRLVIVGDTGGADISSDANCNCDTRIVRIDFRTVSATLSPR